MKLHRDNLSAERKLYIQSYFGSSVYKNIPFKWHKRVSLSTNINMFLILYSLYYSGHCILRPTPILLTGVSTCLFSPVLPAVNTEKEKYPQSSGAICEATGTSQDLVKFVELQPEFVELQPEFEYCVNFMYNLGQVTL